MAKTQQGQPAAQKPAVAEHESAFLKSNAALINETARVYGLADKATHKDRAKVREDWKAVLKDGDGWRIIKNHFGICVILHGFEGRLFEAIYDSHLAKQTGRFAEAMRNVTRLVDFRVDKFAPFVAEQLVDAFYAKFGSGRTAVPAGNLLAAMQQTELTWNPDVQTLEYWIESSARRSSNRAEHDRKVHEQIAVSTSEGEEVGQPDEPKPDPRVELTSKLEAAQARKAQAVESEDFVAAKAAKDEIAQLESELAVLDQPESEPTLMSTPVEVVTEAIVPTTAPTPTPVPVAAVPATTPTAPTPTAITPQPTLAPAPAGNGVANFLAAIEAFKKEVRNTNAPKKVTKELKAAFIEKADKIFVDGNPSALEPARSRFRSLLT